MKAEHAKAQAERKKRLQSRIDQLDAKLQAKLQRKQQRSEELKRELDSKLQGVQQHAAKAQGDAKAALEARVAEIRREYELGKAKQVAASAPSTRQ